MKTILTVFWQACRQGNWFKNLPRIICLIIAPLLFLAHQTTAQQTPRYTSETGLPYSYYEYLPPNYDSETKHPLLVFLHGLGEKGNGSSSELPRVKRNGPPKLIDQGKWPNNRPFIVLSPQTPGVNFNPGKLREMLEYFIDNYKVDPNRVYLTGLSNGGLSTYFYLDAYGSDLLAAAIPIAGKGQLLRSNNPSCSQFNNFALWAFHGDNDETVNENGSIVPVEWFNDKCTDKKPWKVTIYKGVGHNSWERTYDLSGRNSSIDSQYDPFDQDIYEWLLAQSKDGTSPPPPANQSPIARAGADVTVQLPASEVVLDGSGSSDADGSLASYAWQQISGPSGVSLSGQSTSQLTVSNLLAGSYTFELTVSDDQGASDADRVALTVEAAPDEPTDPDPPTSTNVWLEAECASSVGSAWQAKQNSQASGGEYVVYKGSSSMDQAPGGSKAELVYAIDLEQGGNYYLLARIQAPSNAENSVWVKIDEGAWIKWWEEITLGNSFHWNLAPGGAVSLSPGAHTLRVAYRESGTQLDKLLLSTESTLPEGTGPQASNCTSLPPSSQNGVAYRYYEDNTTSRVALPDFSTLVASKEGTLENFSLSPAEQPDYFLFSYTSYLEVAQAGQYTFFLTSDDGSRLWVEDQLVVDHDGPHGASEKAGSVTLEAGRHKVEVGYFERRGDQVLQVAYQGPGISKQLIPNEALFLEGNNEPTTPPTTATQTIQFNFIDNSVSSNLVDWNDLAVNNINRNRTFTGFTTTKGESSDIHVTVYNGQQGSTLNSVADNNNALTGGIYPNAVLRYAAYTSSQATIELSNLDPTQTYTLILLGGRAGSTPRLTEYVVNGNVKSLQSANNKTKVVTFSSVSPTAEGKITITFREGGNKFGYLNALVVSTTADNARTASLPSKKDFKSPEQKQDVVALYPNPANAQLTVRFLDQWSPEGLVALIDLSGRVVRNLTWSTSREGSIQLDTRDIPEGIYLLRLRASTQLFTKKVLIKH